MTELRIGRPPATPPRAGLVPRLLLWGTRRALVLLASTLVLLMLRNGSGNALAACTVVMSLALFAALIPRR